MFSRSATIFVALFVLLALVACAAPPAPSSIPSSGPVPTQTSPAQSAGASALAKKLKVAFLFSGVVNDGAYNTHGYNAMQIVQKKFGLDVVWNEKVTPADSPRVMGEFASGGVNVIWGHTSQYLDPMMKLAKDFPTVSFVTYPSDPVPDAPKNLWQGISAQGIREMYYMAGVVAGQMTKSNVIGFVGGVEIKVYADGAKAFEAGAQYVNPKVKMLKVFTGNWEDAPKAKEATLGQMEQGADVFAHAMNMGVYGIAEAIKTKPNVWLIGKDIDQTAVAPDRVMTSIMVNYQKEMEDLLPRIAQGELGGVYTASLATNSITVTPLASMVPQNVTTKFEEVKSKVAKGELKP